MIEGASAVNSAGCSITAGPTSVNATRCGAFGGLWISRRMCSRRGAPESWVVRRQGALHRAVRRRSAPVEAATAAVAQHVPLECPAAAQACRTRPLIVAKTDHLGRYVASTPGAFVALSASYFGAFSLVLHDLQCRSFAGAPPPIFSTRGPNRPGAQKSEVTKIRGDF